VEEPEPRPLRPRQVAIDNAPRRATHTYEESRPRPAGTEGSLSHFPGERHPPRGQDHNPYNAKLSAREAACPQVRSIHPLGL
jgi:hypothetical protein